MSNLVDIILELTISAKGQGFQYAALMEILHLMKFQKMNFLTKNDNKHPIDYFNLVSKYNVSGGIADIEWKCNDHFSNN